MDYLFIDGESRRLDFEKAVRLQRAALLSLSGQQMNLLMRYVETLREQRHSMQKQLVSMIIFKLYSLFTFTNLYNLWL